MITNEHISGDSRFADDLDGGVHAGMELALATLVQSR